MKSLLAIFALAAVATAAPVPTFDGWQVKDVTIEELPPTPPAGQSLGGLALQSHARKKAGRLGLESQATKKRDTSYNAVQGTAKTAAEQQQLFHLPNGCEIELVVQESDGLGKFVSVYFDQRGRLWTQTAFEYPVDGNENPAAAEALYQSRAKDRVVVFPREALNAPLPAGGLANPTVFADGLAIPLGILPWGAGDACYIQHGHDLKLFKDTDGDGRADTHEIILTGFGVQDSHLFPHQFTRAPGGWIWMAQGLFNNSKAQKPGDEKTVDWPKCSMAKMRPDGSQFEVTSTGPNNIWGLVITGEGEAFIQEANDYGYPVMPFHEYAYYPGGMEPLRRSYQPEFPATAEFRMGGTGLSGLALGEGAFRKLTPTLKADGLCMFVANPIISKVQTIAMHRRGGGGESGGTEDGRAGPRWRLEQAADLLTCDDPFFRPVAMTAGPDGCLYIVDWYNKIISHNEVPRAHPDRDKTRGRIWRIVARPSKVAIPDFIKLSGDELIAKLGAEPLAQSHLAWQALADWKVAGVAEKVRAIVEDKGSSASRRIQALWALIGQNESSVELETSLLLDSNRNMRREVMRSAEPATTWQWGESTKEFARMSDDPDPEVRAEFIRWVAKSPALDVADGWIGISLLLNAARAPLAEPVAPSARGGKPIKVDEAYDREFERFLVRMFLERHPGAVAKFLDSDAARPLPVEARLLASLALEPRASAARVAKLLPQLQRAPGQEEVLRLAQFPDEPGVGEALRAALNNPATRTGVLEALLATRTRLDSAKLTPLLTDAASQLLAKANTRDLGLRLATGFQLAGVEAALLRLAAQCEADLQSARTAAPEGAAQADKMSASHCAAILQALAGIGSTRSEIFASIFRQSPDPAVREAALTALASSKSQDGPQRTLGLWPDLSPTQRRSALDRLASTKPGAKTIVSAIRSGAMAKDELDGPAVEKLQAVLGDDPALTALLGELASLFRPVLTLNGEDDAWTETGVTLDGPFTVECWVRLEPKITNDDGILGAPGQLDMNFHAGKFRVWVGDGLHDVAVSSKPVTAGLWAHVAAVRDARGRFRLYQDGELTAEGAKVAPRKFADVRIGWTGRPGGTAGALDEFRIWNVARSSDEIRRDFDRGSQGGAAASPPRAPEAGEAVAAVRQGATRPSPLLAFNSATRGWGRLQGGAKVARTRDFPPILSAAEATALDAKFARYRALAAQPGDIARGKNAAVLCQACHLFKGQGGAIGPDLSGVGAMGIEAILRNLLTPNAAMEAGYRIYRVALKTGDLVDAFFVSEDQDAVVIRAPGAPDRRIAKSEIRSTGYLRRSLMPEGLLEVLPPGQVSDLLAYLLSLK